MSESTKLFYVVVFIFALCLTASAQSTVTHIVKRGETLSSIAKDYGITEHRIIQLNKSAKSFIYAGMELTIPTDSKQEHSINQEETEYISSRKGGDKLEGEERKKAATFNFGNLGVSYIASFDLADQGYYMVGGSIYFKNFGIELLGGMNAGLAPNGYSGSVLIIGPYYGYAFGKVLISSSLDFIGAFSSTGPVELRKEGDSDIEFKWGIALEPRITYKFGKIFPWAGLPIQWSKDTGKLGVGFHIGIGFDI